MWTNEEFWARALAYAGDIHDGKKRRKRIIKSGQREHSDSTVSSVNCMMPTAVRISLSICLAVIVSGPLSAQKEKFTHYAVNTGGVYRPDLEAHLGSATAKEVGASLGPKMVSARGLVVIWALVTNKNRSEPLHVSASSVHLKLPSGDILSALSPEEVSAWAREVGVSKIPHPELLKGFEIKKGEALAALMAVFRLPKGVEAKRVDAEMTLELGSEGTLQVKSTLF